jgi:hypothetical protein
VVEPKIGRFLKVIGKGVTPEGPGAVCTVFKANCSAPWLNRAVAESLGARISIPIPADVEFEVGDLIEQCYHPRRGGWYTILPGEQG